jgi:hypothetical protein
MKLSSRKELLNEAEQELKSIKTSVNETPPNKMKWKHKPSTPLAAGDAERSISSLRLKMNKKIESVAKQTIQSVFNQNKSELESFGQDLVGAEITRLRLSRNDMQNQPGLTYSRVQNLNFEIMDNKIQYITADVEITKPDGKKFYKKKFIISG